MNHFVHYEMVHKSIQLSYQYKNKDDKLYFIDHQYQKGEFKCQKLYYPRKKRMKEIEMRSRGKEGDRRNIMIS